MGNQLAAKRLALTLKQYMAPATDIIVQPAEDLCPGVFRAGQRMLEIASNSSSNTTRHQLYMALIEELQAEFPPNFEVATHTNDIHSDVRSLADFLRRQAPDLVIGTKGYFSRLAEAATRYIGLHIPIANYVTNDGLLTLPLHHCSGSILNLVQTDFGANLLPKPLPFKIVGPLMGQLAKVNRLGTLDERPLIAILCNRNPEYRAIYDALFSYGENIRVKTIVMGCPELLAELQQRAPENWDILDAQHAKDYLELLAEMGAESKSMFVTKSSPNAVLEAVSANLPVLALDSGLPMEKWMLQLIDENGLGWSAPNLEQAISILQGLIDQPKRIVDMSDSVSRYARQSLDSEKNSKNIYDSISSLLTVSDRVDGQFSS